MSLIGKRAKVYWWSDQVDVVIKKRGPEGDTWFAKAVSGKPFSGKDTIEIYDSDQGTRWKLVGSAVRDRGRRARRDVERISPKELRRLQRQIFVWQFPNERNRFSRNYKWTAWDDGEAQVLGDALIHYGYPSLARALSNLLNRVRQTQRQHLTSRGNKLQHGKDWVFKDYKMAASINRRISRAIREIEGKRKKRASGVRKSQRVFILQSEGNKCVAVLLRKRNPWNSAQYPSSDLHEWFSINLIRANSRREAVRAARKHWPEAKGPLTTRERQRLGV